METTTCDLVTKGADFIICFHPGGTASTEGGLKRNKKAKIVLYNRWLGSKGHKSVNDIEALSTWYDFKDQRYDCKFKM